MIELGRKKEVETKGRKKKNALIGCKLFVNITATCTVESTIDARAR